MDQPKIDYSKKALEEILTFKGRRPSLLLHSCCGPCSTHPLCCLAPHFEITLYYGNSNIFPEEEYLHRLEEQKKFLSYFERDFGYHVSLVAPPYDHEAYMEDLRPLADCREGGERCHLCYKKRMEEAYAYASDHGFEYFATLMTVSRQKDSQVLNRLGEELSKAYPRTKYFFSDFKKDDGNAIGNRLAASYGLYRQNYCGCEYSIYSKEDGKGD